jgi:hypothetical protein
MASSDPAQSESTTSPAAKATPGESALLFERRLTPMEAVNVLYSDGDHDVAEAIIASLSRQVFDADYPEPANRFRRRVAGLLFRFLKRTTRAEVRTGPNGEEMVVYRNAIIERSGHPYALTLLEPSMAEAASFVEGGDPMNAPYMMIIPEISSHAGRWDRIFLNSVQGKDVRLRFMWETKFTYEVAKKRLDRGEPVRLKAAAAGTGLSTVLVFDRLIRDGVDPQLITATISDRDAANVDKTDRLLRKLASTRDRITEDGRGSGICSLTKDVLHLGASPENPDDEVDKPYDIITLVGLLEYFRGFTCASTEEHQGQTISEDGPDAVELIRKIGEITAESGVLIANSYRVEIGARILEIFGKRLYFRNRKDLQALVETAGFVSTGMAGSGNVYDVEVFEKGRSQASVLSANFVTKREM